MFSKTASQMLALASCVQRRALSVPSQTSYGGSQVFVSRHVVFRCMWHPSATPAQSGGQNQNHAMKNLKCATHTQAPHAGRDTQTHTHTHLAATCHPSAIWWAKCKPCKISEKSTQTQITNSALSLSLSLSLSGPAHTLLHTSGGCPPPPAQFGGQNVNHVKP